MNGASDKLDLTWLPPEGTLVAGRYRLGERVGVGGMAAVLSALHEQLGDRVAIKFLHPDVARDQESQQRFLREARISTLIKCEHVVRVVDVGMHAGLNFLVMEFLEGEDLSSRVRRGGPLPVSLAVDCTLQVAEALALAHAAGVVHRDIKPSNVWLAQRADGSPLVKVLDFGISKLFGQGSDPSLTETSSVFGSPTYMSPEQIRSAKRVDARADVWAVGVMLHELLTGRLPFEGDNVGGILASITADPPARVRDVRPDVPTNLEEVVLACLEKDPARRITLAELARELQPFGSLVGGLSASRVHAVGAAKPTEPWRARASLLAPAVGASTLSAATLRNVQSSGQRRWLVVGAASLVAGAVALVVLGREPQTTAVNAEIPPAPGLSAALSSAPPPPVKVEPPSLPSASTPAAVASALPSAMPPATAGRTGKRTTPRSPGETVAPPAPAAAPAPAQAPTQPPTPYSSERE